MTASARKMQNFQSDSTFFHRNRFLLIFLLIYLVLSVFLFDPKLFTGGDNAVYVNLAQAIANGKGYRDLYLPDEPLHTHYPFGFPLLLSFFILLFGPNTIILKLVMLLIGLGSVCFMYKTGELLLKDRINIVMPYFVSLPVFIKYNHWILSEMPFLFFSLGALYFFMKACEGKTIFYYISFIFATYSFFIRTAGITLIVSLMVFLILKRQYKCLIICLLIFLAVFIPWQIRMLSTSGSVTYIDQLLAMDPFDPALRRIGILDFLARVCNNFIFYFFLIIPKAMLSVIQSKTLVSIIGFLFMPLIVIGFIIRMKRFSILELYFMLSLLLIFIWPQLWSSERYVFPIMPFILMYLFIALYWLSHKITLKFIVPGVVTVVVLLNIIAISIYSIGNVANNIDYIKGDKWAGYTPDFRHFFETIEWTKDNVPEGKIIMARKPEFVYLLAKHKSFIYPHTSDYYKLKDAVLRSDYIIFDKFYIPGKVQHLLLPVIKHNPGMFEIVYETRKPKFFVLKVLRETE